MRAGKIRHKVEIEFYENQGRSDSGAVIYDWVGGNWEWASIEPLRGRLLFAAQQANSETTVRIRMRWRADVAEETGNTVRLRHQGRTYRVEGRPMDPDGRRRELEIMAQEWA